MATDDLLALYRDASFARRMAAGLVGEGAAEDVWQEAWRAVLEKPPAPGWDLRGHLWTVVRRLALRQRRGERRRHGRERAVARAESLPSSDELVERMEIHRGVVAALLALDEPYRRTLLLIFFEDLEPAEIARRDGVPLETVRTRKKRALAQMRARLEREHGERPEWLHGLVALAGRRTGEAAAPSTGLALGAGAALAAALFLAWFVWGERDEPVRSSPKAAATARLALDEPGDRALTEPRVSSRNAEPVGVRPVPAEASRGVRLGGRITDEAGGGIGGAEVRLAISGLFTVESLAATRADAEGRYAVELPALTPLAARARALRIEAWARGFQCAQLELPLSELGRAAAPDLVLRAGVTLEGRVLDARGQPVAKALVSARRAGRAEPLRATTDELGTYRLGLDAHTELARLEAWRGDVGWGALAALPVSPEALARVDDIALLEGTVLRGRATYPDGTPARELGIVAVRVVEDERGRLVAAAAEGEGLSRANGSTDDDGRFALFGLGAGRCAFGAAASPPRADPERGFAREQVVWAGREEAQLTFDRRRVLVEVVGPSGEPLEDVAVACTGLVGEPDGAWRPAGESIRSITRGRAGRAAFARPPSEALALTVALPGWARELVLDGGEAWESVCRVDLDEVEASGALRLRPEDSAPLDGFEVRLATAAARLPLERAWRSERDGLVRALPAGAFRAEIVADADGAPWRLPFVRRLEIPADGTLEVPLEARDGGRLVLAFEGAAEVPPEAPPSAPAGSSWLNWQTWASWQPEKPRAFLWRAASAGGEPEFLALSQAAPGGRWTSATALAPGRYRLETRFAGYEPVARWIDVAAGRTNEVVVPLVATPEER